MGNHQRGLAQRKPGELEGYPLNPTFSYSVFRAGLNGPICLTLATRRGDIGRDDPHTPRPAAQAQEPIAF